MPSDKSAADFELPSLDEEVVAQQEVVEVQEPQQEVKSPKSIRILSSFQADALAEINSASDLALVVNKIRNSLDGILSTTYGQDTEQALVSFLGKANEGFGIEEERDAAHRELEKAQKDFKISKPKDKESSTARLLDAAVQVAAYAIIAGDKDQYDMAKSYCETPLQSGEVKSSSDVTKAAASKVDVVSEVIRR